MELLQGWSNDDPSESNEAGNYRISNNKTTITSKSFKYKIKIIGVPNDNSRLDTEVVVLLNDLSNFWRSLNLPLITVR